MTSMLCSRHGSQLHNSQFLQHYNHYIYDKDHSTPSQVIFSPIKFNDLFPNRSTTFSLPHASRYPSNGDKMKLEGNLLKRSVNESIFSLNHYRSNFGDAGRVIQKYVNDGFYENAVWIYLKMLENGDPVEQFGYFPCLVKAFGGLSDVKIGRQIHGHVMKLGALEDVYIGNSVLGMYMKCGEVGDAAQVFDKMPLKDTVSWNAMLSGSCQLQDYERSLMVLRQMIGDHGVYLDRMSCSSALSLVSSLKSLVCGKEIHGFVLKSEMVVDQFLVSTLIDMYMKCGDVRYGERVFRCGLLIENVRANAVVWNVMISGYAYNGYLYEGLEIFLDMLELGIKPDHSTIIALLGLCSQFSALNIGRQIHGFILSSGLDNDVRVKTALIDMYFKCSDPETGLKIFDLWKTNNVVMWGMIVTNCAQFGYSQKVLELFSISMLEYGFAHSVLVLAALRACSSLASMSWGMEVHGLAVKLGIQADTFVGSALVDMYAKCGDMESSAKVFNSLSSTDLVSWNSLISGYAQNDHIDKALGTIRHMQSEQVTPNNVTIASMLSVCAHQATMNLCKEVHGYILRQGFGSNVLVCNSLMATYARCGDINTSWNLFQKMPERNTISWNSIILGLGVHGHVDEMLDLYKKMKASGLKPDHATFTALLSGCSHAGRVDTGWEFFHSMVEDYKLEPRLEQYSCMVDLLGRAGHLKQAYDLIMNMPCTPDDRMWGSLLASCKIYGNEELAELVAPHIFSLNPESVGYHVLLANLYEELGKWIDVTRTRHKFKDIKLKKQPGCSWIEVNNGIHTFVASDGSHKEIDEIYRTIKSLTTEIQRLRDSQNTPLHF